MPDSITLAVAGEIVTTTGGGAVTVIVAAADLEGSATDVAVRVTVAGLGRVAGAVYVIAVPDALLATDRVPHVAPLQPAPDSVQFTPLAAESP